MTNTSMSLLHHSHLVSVLLAHPLMEEERCDFSDRIIANFMFLFLFPITFDIFDIFLSTYCIQSTIAIGYHVESALVLLEFSMICCFYLGERKDIKRVKNFCNCKYTPLDNTYKLRAQYHILSCSCTGIFNNNCFAKQLRQWLDWFWREKFLSHWSKWRDGRASHFDLEKTKLRVIWPACCTCFCTSYI